MQRFPIHLLTYNCGKSTPSNLDFKEKIKKSYGTKDDTEPKNLYVFGFQELDSILNSLDYNKINRDLIKLADIIVDSLDEFFNSEYEFEVVEIQHSGSVGLIVVSPFATKVIRTHKSYVPTGYYFTSIKSSCGIRLQYQCDEGSDEYSPRVTEFTFVVSHFNANEGQSYMIRRNQDFMTTLLGLEFTDGFSMIKPDTHCFIMGDFNYRASGGYTDDSLKTPKDPIDIHNLSDNNNSQYIKEQVRLKDELFFLLKKKGSTFWNFSEGDITFMPCYKFNKNTSNYNPKRIPSWCDRILYQSYDKNSKEVIHEYNSIPSLKQSDHIPVYLLIDVPYKPPANIISDGGYLINPYDDGFTNNDDDDDENEGSGGRLQSREDIYLKLNGSNYYNYIRLLGSITDNIFRIGLLSIFTNKGRASVFLLIALISLYKFYAG
ncbi:hypothetical protein BVG19_g3105 [[Candida] boidinii]|nr:hypothetical protein BVG19_g3105 [[Candida] boidinii]OWB50958.1 hypothetical protein B5S27_g2513 [[Candida] boidinii]